MTETHRCPGPPHRLVLASASPRRQALLAGLGLRFEVDPSDVAEDVPPDARIEAVVADLAVAKARQVASPHADALVIAADTLVEIDGCILGKPADAADARSLLAKLAGRTHRVLTGLAVLDTTSGETKQRLVETRVTFRQIDAPEIAAYVATGEPLDKAGAYGIQGLGAVFVSRIEGDYYNVAGLPVAALNDLLAAFGCCVICYQRGS
jgi:septum formation protein